MAVIKQGVFNIPSIPELHETLMNMYCCELSLKFKGYPDQFRRAYLFKYETMKKDAKIGIVEKDMFEKEIYPYLTYDFTNFLPTLGGAEKRCGELTENILKDLTDIVDKLWSIYDYESEKKDMKDLKDYETAIQVLVREQDEIEYKKAPLRSKLYPSGYYPENGKNKKDVPKELQKLRDEFQVLAAEYTQRSRCIKLLVEYKDEIYHRIEDRLDIYAQLMIFGKEIAKALTSADDLDDVFAMRMPNFITHYDSNCESQCSTNLLCDREARNIYIKYINKGLKVKCKKDSEEIF